MPTEQSGRLQYEMSVTNNCAVECFHCGNILIVSQLLVINILTNILEKAAIITIATFHIFCFFFGIFVFKAILNVTTVFSL